MKKPPSPPRPASKASPAKGGVDGHYVPGQNAKTCTLTNDELEKLVVNHAATALDMKPPFVHHISKDERLRVIVVVLEPVANVLEFPAPGGTSPKKKP